MSNPSILILASLSDPYYIGFDMIIKLKYFDPTCSPNSYFLWSDMIAKPKYFVSIKVVRPISRFTIQTLDKKKPFEIVFIIYNNPQYISKEFWNIYRHTQTLVGFLSNECNATT